MKTRLSALTLLSALGTLALGGCINNTDKASTDTEDATASGGAGGAPAESDAGPGGTGGSGAPDRDAAVEADAATGGTITPDAAVPPPPTCDQEDANAGNGGQATATPVLVGFSRSDLFLCAGTEDWYTLTLDAGTYVVFQITADPAEIDLDLFLTDADGNVLTQSATETGAEQIAFTAETAGAYFLRVVGGFRDVAAPYALSVTSACRLDSDCGADQICSLFSGQCEDAPAAACGGDAAEENDRDAAAFALDVAAGPFDAVICGADPDWYKVTVADGEDLDVLVSFPGGEDLDLVVRNLSTGALVGTAAGDANTNPERLHLAHLTAGDYALGVLFYEMDAGGTREVEYRIDVATTAGRCATDADCTGANGPICDAATGACGPVPDAGRVAIGGQCGNSADCADQGAFCAAAGPGGADNYCTIECGGDDAECAALGDGAYCLRSMGVQVCTRACSADNQCSATRECVEGRCQRRAQCASNDDCDAGQVCAQTPFGAFVCQDLPPPADCGQDANPDGTVRVDDDAEHAVALAADGAPLEGQHICDGDRDWFRVTVPADNAADALVATLSFRAGVDLDLYVVDAAGNTIGGAASADQTDEIATLRLLPAGDYFLVVDQYASDALADTDYRISAVIQANEDRCTVEGNECAGTEPLRMACDAMTGACGSFDGEGMVALGGLCDSDDDCGAGAEVCWTFEGAAGSQRGANICTHTCQAEADCADVPNTTCVDFQQAAVCLPGN
jgi:hypothetical protein